MPTPRSPLADLMTVQQAAIVQFPHPGGEHQPKGDLMPWNTGGHRRKFLIAQGSYLDGDDRLKEAELVFWGEWEPPSRIEKRWPSMGLLPSVLHRPYWARPSNNQPRQNTDPWVFGDTMIYSNCKQVTGPNRNPTSMQELEQGSVICFGSTIQGKFCLDTMFVVGASEPWIPAAFSAQDVDEAFAICTAESVAGVARDRHRELTLYRGATYHDPVAGMYSFVPAKLAGEIDPRFARPSVESKFINPLNTQSTKGSKVSIPMGTVHEAWTAIRDQVVAQGLLVAVQIQTPERLADQTAVPENDRDRC